MSAISARLRTLSINSERASSPPQTNTSATDLSIPLPEHFIGRRFQLDAEATLIDLPSGPRAWRFGSTGLNGAVVVDLETGHVLELVDTSGSTTVFVNTSLKHFAATVQSVAERFPYYSENASDDEIEAVSDDLLRIVQAVDRDAAEADRYWSTVVDDARMGDLTTESILAIDH